MNLNQSNVTSWVSDRSGFSHPFVFDFEKILFNKTYADNIYNWMNQWWWLSIVFSITYVGLIHFGRSLMENHDRFELRVPLLLWNTAVALFSLAGTVRSVPEVIYDLNNHGLQYTVCDNSYMYSVVGFWGLLLIILKAGVLIDTLFIVLRKQKLIFLHWFHHSTALVFTWYSFSDLTASLRLFGSVNYTVHAMAYPYFAFRGMNYRIPKWIQIIIGILEISQMAVGCFINYKAYIYKKDGVSCNVTYSNIFWSFLIYAIHFVFFLHFGCVILLLKKTELKKSDENQRKKKN